MTKLERLVKQYFENKEDYHVKLILRLKRAYVLSPHYGFIPFLVWVFQASPSDFECEFNSHEIMELFIDEDL